MHSTHSVGHAASGGSENLQAAPPPLQHGQHAGQGGSTGAVPIAALAAPQPIGSTAFCNRQRNPTATKARS